MSDSPRRLDDAEIAAALEALQDWSLEDGKLQRRFVFRDFVEAFGFMSAAALCAERADHHPDWRNVYRQVDVQLWTHEAGGLTQRDIDLARELDGLAGRMS